MKKTQQLLLFFSILLFSCTVNDKKGTTNETRRYPVTINLEELTGKNSEEINLSTFIDSIEYVPLETNPKALIGNALLDIDVSDSFIFVTEGSNILKFSRNGKFLHKIGSQGKGSGQYLGLRNISLDEKKKIVYIYPNYNRKIFKYSFDGEYLGDISFSGINTNNDRFAMFSYIKDNRFITVCPWCYPYPGIRYENKFLAALMDSTTQIIKELDFPLKQFDNYTKRKDIMYMGTFSPTYYDSLAIILGRGCDTVYSTTGNDFNPRYILNSGKYKLPAHIIYGYSDDFAQRIKISKKIYNYIFIDECPLETDSSLIIKFSLKGVGYLAAFNKKGGKIIVFHKKGEVKYGHTLFKEKIGFYNEIDGGLSFYPKKTILNGTIWVDIYDAIKLKDKLDEIKQAKGVKYPDWQKALIKLIENLKDSDNPVVAIAHVKYKVF